MTRQRYLQNPLPMGPAAPKPVIYGPEQPNPPGLQRIEQGLLEVMPLGPLFDEEESPRLDSQAGD